MPIPAHLPDPPDDLSHKDVVLQFWQMTPANDEEGLVPAYHFRIVTSTGTDVGRLSIRVGDTSRVWPGTGNVGFRIQPEHRGRGYAARACLAAADFVAALFQGHQVLITCDPDNIASIRTIERIGGIFMDQVDVPAEDEQGCTRKNRYCWPV